VPGLEKVGWIYTSEADFLVYIIAPEDSQEIKIYIINMKKLRQFYFDNINKYPKNKTNQINKTEFISIPFEDIKKSFGYKLIIKNK
jgi:hypothetical protein